MKKIIFIISCFLFFFSCKDLQDYPLPNDNITTQGISAVYILCEGLFAQNSSSLAYYNFEEKCLVRDIFNEKNARKIGDTANDMQQYGSKIYIVVDNSGTVEVIDTRSGKSLKQIVIRNANGRNRHPRNIAFCDGKAYLACFDSTVCKIDTATFAVESVVQTGAYPDGICVANGKIYVSNSGERASTGTASTGNTVSVIDISSFQKIKEIAVADNPFKMAADSEDDVYLVSRGSFRGDGPYVFQKINTKTDEVEQAFPDIEALNFAICRDTAYIYCYNFVTQQNSVLTFDCLREQVIDRNFIKDNTKLHTPYGIAVNAQNGDVYITDAGSFTATGDVYCFNRDGVCKFKIGDVGINPNAMIFSYAKSNGSSPGKVINHISEVIDYHPAPGQFIGETAYLPADKTIETATYEDVLQRVREILIHPEGAQGVVSLGAWGGYITLGFNEPVRNIAGKHDFRIYGNAYYHLGYENIGGSCEPGIVLVSNDGATWYELKGSEYDNPQTIHNYEITYHKPAPIGGNVRWTDNKNNEGYVYRNEYHHQASYFPLWTNAETLTFKGSRLPDNGEETGGVFMLKSYHFGYADNKTNAEATFDISWTVDSNGNTVELDEIRYIRIYSAVNLYHPVIGEVSTEISGVEILK